VLLVAWYVLRDEDGDEDEDEDEDEDGGRDLQHIWLTSR
jgi:hypothetical protein